MLSIQLAHAFVYTILHILLHPAWKLAALCSDHNPIACLGASKVMHHLLCSARKTFAGADAIWAKDIEADLPNLVANFTVTFSPLLMNKTVVCEPSERSHVGQLSAISISLVHMDITPTN